MNNIKTFNLFLATFISLSLYSNEEICTAKKIQTMKASIPAAKISGYSVVEFDVGKDGDIKKPKVIVSKCLLKNKKTNNKIMSKGDVINFMQTYQRVTQNMFKFAPRYASVILNLNNNHQIKSAVYKSK